MLARKAVVGQVKSDVLVASQGRKRSASVALDLSPMMWQVVYGIAALVAFLLIMMVMNAYSTKLGYEVVKTQQAVVQLTKDNDALDVEVASLKSPVRIQQIAEQQLGDWFCLILLFIAQKALLLNALYKRNSKL